MNRRKMITALGGAVAWPLAALHNGARRIEQPRGISPARCGRPSKKIAQGEKYPRAAQKRGSIQPDVPAMS